MVSVACWGADTKLGFCCKKGSRTVACRTSKSGEADGVSGLIKYSWGWRLVGCTTTASRGLAECELPYSVLYNSLSDAATHHEALLRKTDRWAYKPNSLRGNRRIYALNTLNSG